MVKFKNGPSDLTQLEVVLTDFGMAGSDSKGGTPVFASPECFGIKDNQSDLFSFGRVILFLLLTKRQFVSWLFVPIKDQTRISYLKTLRIDLVSPMISITNRTDLKSARKCFNKLRRDSRIMLNYDVIATLETIVSDEISSDIELYISELGDFRYE